jgi:putative tryptophan/tyrosine transport system substrate-binding protein
MFRERNRIVEFINWNRLAGTFGHKALAEAGGLMSYAADVRENDPAECLPRWQNPAGRSPNRSPVAQPTKYELVINAKMATALGLTIPQSVLVRADQIIRWW